MKSGMISAIALVFALGLLTGGCGSKPQLMPTPNIYANGQAELFPDVPPALQNNRVEVLYLTDRARDEDTAKGAAYSHKRSRSVAVGVSEVQFGENVSWDDLVKASTSRKRDVKLPTQVVRTTEIVRFPPTPKTLVELPDPVASTTQPTTEPSALRALIEEEFEVGRRQLTERLAKTPVKEVYIFVHGVKTSFEGAVTTTAELWHFLGRQGVPVCYTWPASGKGLLRGYNYDYNSSEFTVYHLKQALRVIASCPEVKKIHLISHSRGTDVTVSALRELYLEFSGGGKNTRQELKLGTLILAAPDLDVDVIIQRAATARLMRVPEQSVLYICSKDDALALSRFLFGGLRLGQLKPEIFTDEELHALRNAKTISIVDARVTKPGSFGHNYFYSNPAVSSDLILAIRYGKKVGAELGRPLVAEGSGFWLIDDDYPNMDK